MLTVTDFPSVAKAEGEQKTGFANTGSPLPVISNPNAAKYGFATKLVPVLLDGVHTAWEQVHANSKLTEVRRTSVQALRAAGQRVAFVDYDPIAATAAQCPKNRFMPVWTGD